MEHNIITREVQFSNKHIYAYDAEVSCSLQLTGPFPVIVPIAQLLAKQLNSMCKEKAGAPSTSDLTFSSADSNALAELLAELAKMVQMYSVRLIAALVCHTMF